MKKINNRNEAESLMNDLAIAANNKRKIVAKQDAAILKIQETYAGDIAVCETFVADAEAMLKDWAEANPKEFGKKKSIRFASGTIGFRDGQFKLERASKAMSWDAITEAVARFLPNFIRSKPEIDKEAIIAQREELAPALKDCGLKIEQSERFYTKPNLTETEPAA